ncbi:16S rRNA (cytosine(1402)-N(4))-methyltransferase RsmH [Candidatus Saccharibacteria bacterium]|nr:16S rRNA (cytosine(1402)-N(4))-methyltransferase RsmH [Candidatus Saccharibacteria bacterium]NIV03108.1 16S rRNA (cytosine(1402)-N(4))-methyltransferase RsmH [Calditrichia bacterium]NIV71218.1 16S rRNA (cytosine(1402)-N(4))-methyltransferase RsmH [Calditrichia bacterium]NIV98097.1 16S rRNA (cytosine(1402)-N(4))-methyltransferase RsmH [Candidatus Saccharibacteria bacterium]NIW77971.1 16S rRNA (cytosine(1402)-N(4))-methyltransferase RsmH [Calditrichia bacterium]
MKNGFHQPVLAGEAANYLITNKEGIYVDCTLGGGGHSLYFLKILSPSAFLIGLDADAEAIHHTSAKLADYTNTYFKQAFFDQIEIVLYEVDKLPVDGVFYDLGLSSFQVDQQRRGFSYQIEGPLDMRFNQQQQKTAGDVLNHYSQEELERIIREFGEERHWRAISREIVLRRQGNELKHTSELADIVRSVVGERYLNKSLSRVFQALRIEVNQELKRLPESLDIAFQLLKKGGRMVAISYHSLEDRIVKTFMREKICDCLCPPQFPACVCDKVQEAKLLTRRVVRPQSDEVEKNVRARSARLRAIEKIVPYQN